MLETGLRPTTGRSLVQLIKTITSAGPTTREGEQIHSFIVKIGFGSNQYISSALLGLYSISGRIVEARKVFDEILQPGLVSWTAMVRAYVRLNYPKDALELFRVMRSVGVMPDPVALATVVSACNQLGDLAAARTIHGLISKSGIDMDAYVTTELIRNYGDGGDLVSARHLFDAMLVKSTVAWNAIIHQYAKHGFVEDAHQLFREMPERDVISWNTVISGFGLAGQCREALAMFHEMELSCVRPNKVTLCTVLSTCASLGALDIGTWVHAYIERTAMNFDGSLDPSIIDMYAKCGSIDKAVQVFEKVPIRRRDLYSWTSIICGLAMHGHANHALQLFSQMQDQGVEADEVTLIGVLNACAHAGLVDRGCDLFHSMERKYGFTPKIEHYGCMIDLLGRTGRLREAYNLIVEMPMKPNAVVWGTLISACKVHNDVELGEIVAIKLVEMDPGDPWARVMLSNMYAEGKNWSMVVKLRKEMKEVGMRKTPGCSSIEVNGAVHEFLAGGSLHPQHIEIHAMLENIEMQIQMR